MFEEFTYWLRNVAVIAWLVVKHRPFFICPFCKGDGGAMSGYYEPEWSECPECFDHWSDLVDHRATWFDGRMPLLKRIRAAVSIRAGLWYTARLRDVLSCRLKRHDWMTEAHLSEPGHRICGVCYHHEQDEKSIG